MKSDKKTIIGVLTLAFAFTVMQIMGYQISMFYGTSVHQSAGQNF